jgi:AcrR family transcriptional regulator
MTPDRTSPGRPRMNAEPAILDATLELLGEIGFDRMTMGDIAARSGVSKPAIYRRWPNKVAVVAAAIAHMHRNRPAPTGNVRADLIAELADVRQTYERIPAMGMVGGLLAHERTHPELINAWRTQVVGPRRAGIQEIVERAIASGEVAAGVDPQLISTILIGAYYGMYTAGTRPPRGWEEEVVDLILRSIRTG